MKFLAWLLFVALTIQPATARESASRTILSAATGTGAGSAFKPNSIHNTFIAYGSTTAGAGSATILIKCGNSPGALTQYATLATITLTLGTTVTADGAVKASAYEQCLAHVTAISGTGASVTVVMAAEL